MIGELYFIELMVAKLEPSLRWYEQGLGLRRLPPLDDAAFALLEAGLTHLALKVGTPVPSSILLSFQVTDLDIELRRLAEIGIVPEGVEKISAEGYRRVRLRDPAGYAVTLFEWVVFPSRDRNEERAD